MAETLEREEVEDVEAVAEEQPQDDVEPQEGDSTPAELDDTEAEADEKPSLDAEIKSLAQDIGMSEADISRLNEVGGKDAVWTAINVGMRAAQQMNQMPGGEQQPAGNEGQSTASESPAFAELDLSDLEDDDVLRPKLEGFHKSAKEAFERQRQEIQALRQQVEGFFGAQQQQETTQLVGRFDSALSDLNSDAFGQGRLEEVTSAQQAERQQVWSDFIVLRQALPNRTDESLIQMVLADRPSISPKSKPSDRVKRRARKVQGGQSPQPIEEDRQALYERINERIMAGD